MEFIKNKVIEIGKLIAFVIIDNSYYICLFICLGAIVLYIVGIKKSGKWIAGSTLTYFLLQCLGSVLK